VVLIETESSSDGRAVDAMGRPIRDNQERAGGGWDWSAVSDDVQI